MKNKRPIFPRYQQTWDVNFVLDYLKALSPVNSLSLRTLSLKLVMLFALITGQRVHTLHSLDLIFLNIEDDHVNIEIHAILETSKPGKHLPPLFFPAFVGEPRLCMVTFLKECIKRTEKLRKSQNLFVTYRKPYYQPAISTLSNWIKLVLQLAEVNVKLFETHSTRSANTSAALKAGVSVNTILKSAGLTN